MILFKSILNEHTLIAPKQLDSLRPLNFIGSGTTRDVYKKADGTVIKLAKNTAGIIQNKEEIALGYPPKSQYINTILSFDNNGRWIQCEYASHCSKQAFQNFFGITISELRDCFELEYLWLHYPDEEDELELYKSFPLWRKIRSKTNTSYASILFRELMKLSIKYVVETGDFGRISSWGLNKNGNPVLIDYGHRIH